MNTIVSESVEESATALERADEQRLFYGWVMLPISMAGLIATSPGQTFGVSVFNESMRQTLGLSHGQVAAAYTLGTLLAAVPLIYIGAVMDRCGLRRTMTCVVAGFGAACLLASQAGGWLTLFGAFFLLRCLGPGALALLSANTLAAWFHRRLGMVEGIRHLGMACAMVIVPSLNLWLLNSFGWRGSYAALGVLVWLVMLPLMAFLYRERPEEIGQALDGAELDNCEQRPDSNAFARSYTLGEALRTRAFWIVSAGTATFGMIHTAVFFCIVPMLHDRGLSAGDAAGMLTVFAIGLAGMQFFGGILADRVAAVVLLPIALAGMMASVLLLNRAVDSWMVHACGVGMGISQGLFFAASNPLWARYYGRLHLGKIRGTLSTINIGVSSLGPLLFGVVRDFAGSYDPILGAFAVLPLPLIFLSGIAAPPDAS